MLEVSDVTVQYEQEILSHFSWQFPEAGCVCLFGPSGCGKTTLFQVLLGSVKPQTGSVHGFFGKRISCVFQEDRLFPWMTVIENLLAVNPDRERAQALLEKMGLKEASRKYPKELSGGMRRRVAVARALAFQGDIYLLDEPFQGLDSKRKNAVMELVKEETKGKLMLFITHDRQEAVFFQGEILQIAGPPLRVQSVERAYL